MPATATTDNENGLALVKRGYDEPTRCLNFRVGFNLGYGDGVACALSALRAIGGYNAFDGEAVAQALEPFISGSDVAYRVEVGREGSPVIYLTAHVTGAFRHVIEGAIRDVHADELDWDGDTLRAWWD